MQLALPPAAPSSPPSTTTSTTTTSTTTTTRSGRATNTTTPRSRHRLHASSSSSSINSSSGENTAIDAAAHDLITQLEPLSLALTVDVRHDADVRFVLAVRHARAHATWKHPRSFDEYVRFQNALLHALHHGHTCCGECPWLETFVLNYFPAKTHFLTPTKSFRERRSDELLLLVQTIRTFLLQRTNIACAIARSFVGPTFVAFVYGELLHDERVWGVTSSAQALQPAATAAAVAIETRSTVDLGTPEALPLCVLCHASMPLQNIYVTQLRCGHRFHDECVLPKLNEALVCPLCNARAA